MKQLQNNYTTPEQSKKLLELGVPANSADCYYSQTYRTIVFTDEQIDKREFYKAILPIWSVGRLIEIIEICADMECIDFETLARIQRKWPEKLIRIIEELIKYSKMDLSKLEE